VSRERRESLREEECLKSKLKNCNKVTTENVSQIKLSHIGLYSGGRGLTALLQTAWLDLGERKRTGKGGTGKGEKEKGKKEVNGKKRGEKEKATKGTEKGVDVKTFFTFFGHVFYVFDVFFIFQTFLFKKVGRNLKFNGFINNRILYPVRRM